MNGLPITRYQLGETLNYIKAIIVVSFVIIFFGNIITAILKDPVRVNSKSYIIKEGFPLFTSEKDYIKLIKEYPYEKGIRIKIHRIKRGETYWDVAKKHKISIDTILAANPFLKSLMAREGMEIVVPLKDGVLLAVDDRGDVSRMAEMLCSGKDARGNYTHSVFELFSLDDIRFAFFIKSKPILVSRNIQQLYNIRRTFTSPVKGHYTSMYGHRVDPMHHDSCFHNGVDIQARTGTPIRPVTDGIVIKSSWHDGYGLTIWIQHKNGYVSMYGHCSSIRVKKGEWVTRKNVIGSVGSTGRSTGPHLHFSMMRHGRTINPLLFIW